MITRKAIALSELNSSNINQGIELFKKGYPILLSYCDFRGLNTIKFLEETFGEKKKVLKYISVFEESVDKQDYERFLENPNHKNLVSLIGFEKIVDLTRTLKDNDISMHDYVANLPKIHLDDKYPEELFVFLKKICKYSYENMMEVLAYANYKKVRFADNLEQMRKHIGIIRAARGGVTSGSNVTAYMPLTRISSDRQVNFSKEASVIANIGAETLCCFRRGGVAGALLTPAMKSPIAGILEGYLESNKRWFSFVWEMVEYTDGGFAKTLILDNIEAKAKINDGTVLWNRLRDLKGYSTVYCGTSRNDIVFEPGVTDTSKLRQKPLVGYEKAFASYGGYDDSRNVHTIVQNEVDREAVIRRMNEGDLHRAKYVEQYVYGSKADPDFIKIDVKKSPSYIVESYSHIFGYFTTRLKYYEKGGNHRYAQFKDVSGSELRDKFKENKENELPREHGLEKILYLEDIMLLPYKRVKASMKHAFDDLLKWCRENGIEKIVANTNEASQYFVKRIKDAGFGYHEQTDMGGFNVANFGDMHFANELAPTVVINRIAPRKEEADANTETEGDEQPVDTDSN